jgi:hypothetical protein
MVERAVKLGGIRGAARRGRSLLPPARDWTGVPVAPGANSVRTMYHPVGFAERPAAVDCARVRLPLFAMRRDR